MCGVLPHAPRGIERARNCPESMALTLGLTVTACGTRSFTDDPGSVAAEPPNGSVVRPGHSPCPAPSPVIPARATGLFEQTDLLDRDATIHRLSHVDHRQGRDRDGCQGLHLDTRLAGGRHRATDHHTLIGERDLYVNLLERKRVTEGNQIGGSCGGPSSRPPARRSEGHPSSPSCRGWRGRDIGRRSRSPRRSRSASGRAWH